MLKRLAFAGALLCACSPAMAGGYYDDLFAHHASARQITLPAPANRSHRAAHRGSRHYHDLVSRKGPRAVIPQPVPRPVGAVNLLQVAQQFLGRGNFTGLNEAWCADAVNAWLRRAGFAPQASHRAIDFARYGRQSPPRVGAIAVMRGHVGIVAGFARGGVLLLSGNHNHRVGLGVYPSRRIVAYREP